MDVEFDSIASASFRGFVGTSPDTRHRLSFTQMKKTANNAPNYNNAPNMLSFVDAHVSYVKMYYGSNNPSHRFQSPFAFNPPAGYDYKWSGD